MNIEHPGKRRLRHPITPRREKTNINFRHFRHFSGLSGLGIGHWTPDFGGPTNLRFFSSRRDRTYRVFAVLCALCEPCERFDVQILAAVFITFSITTVIYHDYCQLTCQISCSQSLSCVRADL